MQKIRRGLFETNSSSTHSIIVCNNSYPVSHDDALRDLVLDDEGIWHLSVSDLEFGWDPKYFPDFSNRVCYAIASYGGLPEKIKEIEDFLYSFVPELTDIDYPVNPYYDSTDPESSKSYYGYVDHQSSRVLEEFLTNENISLTEFFLDDRYEVQTDNDNRPGYYDDYWDDED